MINEERKLGTSQDRRLKCWGAIQKTTYSSSGSQIVGLSNLDANPFQIFSIGQLREGTKETMKCHSVLCNKSNPINA